MQSRASSGEPIKSTVSWIVASVLLLTLGVILWMSAVMLDYYRDRSKPNAPADRPAVTEVAR